MRGHSLVVVVASASALGLARAPLARRMTRFATVCTEKVFSSVTTPTTQREVVEENDDEVAPQRRVVFCLGGPGAGKGTQCDRLSEQFGYVHLSAGELLRRERASGSEDGDLIESYLAEGKIVPVTMSLGLLRREMEKSTSSHFIIDGFPRNLDNVLGWQELMSDIHVDCVLFYDVPPDVLLERMLERGETSGRSDDNLAAAHKRLATYSESTLPLIEKFEQENLFKVLRIAGIGSIDDVWHLTQDALKPFLPSNLALTPGSDEESSEDSPFVDHHDHDVPGYDDDDGSEYDADIGIRDDDATVENSRR